MKKLIYFLFTFASMIFSSAIQAQDQNSVKGFMHSRERSYVVVAVMLTILAGLIIYIIRIDRKLTKLEKRKEI